MVLSLLLPLSCPVCGARGAAPCPPCRARLRPAPEVAPLAGCATVAACFAYDDAARALLLALKYRNRRDALAFCADALARHLPAVDVVTWAPTTPARARARGFDQAELLARAVAGRARVPVRRLLHRTGQGHQTGRGAVERRAGPAFVVSGRGGRAARVPPRLLLVDDIGTTGATLTHAAAVLGAAGAEAVHARTVAWTPARAIMSRCGGERDACT